MARTTTSDAELVAVLARADDPVLTTREVSERVEISKRQTLERLEELHRAGRVYRKEVPPRATVWAAASDGVRADARAALEAVGVPPGGVGFEERAKALAAIHDHLRRRGAAERADLLEEVYPDHPAGYETPGSWWTNAYQPALRELADRRDDLEPPPSGGSAYRYVGDDPDRKV